MELKGFKSSVVPSICPQRLKQLLMTVILMMCLNQNIVWLYQMRKVSWNKFGSDYGFSCRSHY